MTSMQMVLFAIGFIVFVKAMFNLLLIAVDEHIDNKEIEEIERAQKYSKRKMRALRARG